MTLTVHGIPNCEQNAGVVDEIGGIPSERKIVTKSLIGAALITILAAGCAPAFGAKHLDCMDAPMGGAEQTVLDRHRDARRADDALWAAVQLSLESRSRICAYLNGWSVPAMRLAFQYKWTEIQSGRIPSVFSAAEEESLNIALEPMRPQMIALLSPSASAVARGEDPPPPPLGKPILREFYGLLKNARIAQTKTNEDLLGGWLYDKAFQAAVVDAFSRE